MPHIVVFDIETSHPNKSLARVIEIAYELLDAETLQTVRSYSSLVYHTDDFCIDDASSNVHGITREQCETEGHEITDVVYEIQSDWGEVETIVSHGLDTDIDILALEFIRVLSYWPFSHCTLVCTKELGAFACCIPRGRDGYKWPTLGELWATLFPSEKDEAGVVHRAGADARMCAQCYRQLMQE